MSQLNDLRSYPILLGAALTLACGPGGFASDQGGFGTTDAELGATDDSQPSPSTSNDSSPTDTDTDDTDDGDTDSSADTNTDNGADDWSDPDPDPPPDPIDPIKPECARVWTHVDPEPSHGHIGATPIGGRPDGGFISVTPVLEHPESVNVDARVRSWTANGALDWDQQISWDVHRDDPLDLVTDNAGDIFLGGRINANTFEDAMVAKLDGATGEVLWTYLQGERGSFYSVAHTGAALVAAGIVGPFPTRRLLVIAFEPDTGKILWEAAPALATTAPTVRGLAVGGGLVDVLLAHTSADQVRVDILRLVPLGTEATVLTSLGEDPSKDTAPHDLERFGPNQLAALYSLGEESWLAVVDRGSGELMQTLAIAGLGLAMNIQASELVELPAPHPGLGVAGMLWDGDFADSSTFVARLDQGLQLVCSGRVSKADVGTSWAPQVRGLTVAPNGALTTGSFAGGTRRSVFARWD